MTVDWAASTDNVGVTGYDIYRDGAKMKTVGRLGHELAGHLGGGEHDLLLRGRRVRCRRQHVGALARRGRDHARRAAAGGGGSNPCGTVRDQHGALLAHRRDHGREPDRARLAGGHQRARTRTCWRPTAGSRRNAAGETHPSFPNYLAVTGGTFNTCLACSSTADNIFHQLDVAGMTWKDYNQSMPHNCAANTSSVPYYRDGHNPAFWFTDLGATSKGGDGSCANRTSPPTPTCGTTSPPTPCRTSPGSRPTTAATCTG